jgi:hypothetical protein
MKTLCQTQVLSLWSRRQLGKILKIKYAAAFSDQNDNFTVLIMRITSPVIVLKLSDNHGNNQQVGYAIERSIFVEACNLISSILQKKPGLHANFTPT